MNTQTTNPSEARAAALSLLKSDGKITLARMLRRMGIPYGEAGRAIESLYKEGLIQYQVETGWVAA